MGVPEVLQEEFGRHVERVRQSGDDPYRRFVQAAFELAQVGIGQVGEASELALGQFGEAPLALDEVAERLDARGGR